MYDDPGVTFSGSGFDRAANLRGDAVALQRLLGVRQALCLPLWRGKPLISGDAAGWLPVDHDLFDGHPAEPVFLGLADGIPHFFRDISEWEPIEGPVANASVFLDPSEQAHPKLGPAFRFAELRAVMARLSPLDAELVATAKALSAWHDSHAFCARCGQPSAIVMGGWQRRCPVCGSAHFPRTDPVVIMLVTHGNSVLLGRSPGWPDGMYSLLAGFMEPGETLEAAVRREVFEETGVRVGPVRYLASQPWPFPSSLMIGCAGAAISTEIVIDPQEIEDAFWISREDMAQVAAGLHPTIRPPRRGAIAEFLLSGWLAGRMD